MYALIDTGAGGKAFFDKTFAQTLGLRLRKLRRRIRLYGFDDTCLDKITHYARLQLEHNGRREWINALITNLGSQKMILGLPWMKENKVNFDWEQERLVFPPRYDYGHDPEPLVPWELAGTTNHDHDKDSFDIRMVSATTIYRIARRRGYQIFAVSLADVEKALEEKPTTDPREKLPPEYHDLLGTFSRKEADKLPRHRAYDHRIELLPGKEEGHGFGPLYGMSRNELLVLKKYLEDNLSKGFIRASRSPVASPVIFVRKPGGGLRFCVDYRKLNEITVKNRYPIPLIQETLARLSQARWYTKLDIIAAFNRMRIAEGYEYLTAFRTRYGLFESLVMPFGLTGAPATFQHYINDVLRPFLDLFCTAYIDDVLVYSKTLREHRHHVRQVLVALQEAGLQLDIDKCEFHQEQVLYLGLIISREGIKMDPTKIQAILDWEEPKNVRDVRGFLGFANFYRRFIDGYSEIVVPLVNLTKKDQVFSFDTACQRAFKTLQEAFVSAPVLRHFDPDLPCIVEADSSDYATGGILSQVEQDGTIRPVAYFSKKLAPAEYNYEIYDKELLAIIRCFEQWRPELEGAAFPIEVLSDHKNLQYFCTTKQLNARQARWSEYLSRFNFVIKYRPGKQGQKPDALTRRSQDQPTQEAAREARRQRPLLDPSLFVRRARYGYDPKTLDPTLYLRLEDHEQELHEPTVITGLTVNQLIDREYEKDTFLQETLELLRSGKRRSKHISLSECELRKNDQNQDRLYYRGRLVIPDLDELKLKLLQYIHDSPIGGHPGRTKTLDLVSRSYYWPNMYETVRKYVASCHVCQRSKASREAYQGLLRPLPIPDRRWEDISVDFVVKLPKTLLGNTNFMVVVDRLTKLAHVIPCSDISAPTTAKLFLRHVWKHHGLPSSIVSDRGSQFISAFWDHLCQRLGIQANLSTAFHPESDGQTERVNSIIEQYLRAYVNYHQDDWDEWTPMAEFCYNNAASETTQVSPFYATYGQNPRLGIEPPRNLGNQRGPRQAEIQEANEFAEKMDSLTKQLRDQIRWSQEVYEAKANRLRKPAPAYQVGDLVWLNTKNIETKRPAKKLDWKWVGPFPVTKVVSPYSYRLELPSTMKIHNVFHTSLLRPVASPGLALPGQTQEPPPPIKVAGKEEYVIEEVKDARKRRGSNRTIRFDVLVQWKGYSEPTWEPLEALEETAALDSFEQRYPRWKEHLEAGLPITGRSKARRTTRRVRFALPNTDRGEGATVTE